MNEREKKISAAVTERHANTDKEVLSARMSAAGRARWSRVSQEDRRAYALKMVAARTNKK